MRARPCRSTRLKPSLTSVLTPEQLPYLLPLSTGVAFCRRTTAVHCCVSSFCSSHSTCGHSVRGSWARFLFYGGVCRSPFRRCCQTSAAVVMVGLSRHVELIGLIHRAVVSIGLFHAVVMAGLFHHAVELIGLFHSAVALIGLSHRAVVIIGLFYLAVVIIGLFHRTL